MDIEQIRELMMEEQQLWKESDELRDFAALNHTAFFKILKKHDKIAGKIAAVLPPGTVNPFLARWRPLDPSASSLVPLV